MIKNILEYLTNLWYTRDSKNYDRECDKMSRINNKLEQKANNILVSNDMLKLPVDLIKIAENNNIDVYYKELPEHISGAIKYDNLDRKFKILLNKSETKNRIRFTLAHELAHYFLTQKELKESGEIFIDTMYRQDNSNEQDVDYLAGALLMDKEILERAYRAIQSISVLAKIFEVSEAAMTVRLIKLGLI